MRAVRAEIMVEGEEGTGQIARLVRDSLPRFAQDQTDWAAAADGGTAQRGIPPGTALLGAELQVTFGSPVDGSNWIESSVSTVLLSSTAEHQGRRSLLDPEEEPIHRFPDSVPAHSISLVRYVRDAFVPREGGDGEDGALRDVEFADDELVEKLLDVLDRHRAWHVLLVGEYERGDSLDAMVRNHRLWNWQRRQTSD